MSSPSDFDKWVQASELCKVLGIANDHLRERLQLLGIPAHYGWKSGRGRAVLVLREDLDKFVAGLNGKTPQMILSESRQWGQYKAAITKDLTPYQRWDRIEAKIDRLLAIWEQHDNDSPV